VREHDLHLDAIYVPFGTGGIFTALLLALREQEITCPLIGISVNQAREFCYEQIETWWLDLCRLLECDPARSRGVYELYDDFIGRAYGDPTEECLDAIMMMAQTEGILLDPVYSGKVMAGFLAHQAAGRWSRQHHILLLHSGGVPALFAYAKELREHLEKRGVDLLSELNPAGDLVD
jgi:D-cysteine desulfhydrase